MKLVIVTKYVKLRSKKPIIVYRLLLDYTFYLYRSLFAVALKTCFLIVDYNFPSAKLQNIFLKMKFSCSKFAISWFLIGFRHFYPPPYCVRFFTFDLYRTRFFFFLFKMKYPDFLFFKVCLTLLFYLCTQLKDVIV